MKTKKIKFAGLLLSLALTLAVFGAMTVNAVDADGLNYTVTSEPSADVNGTVKLSGCEDGFTAMVIPTTVTIGGNTYTVTAIADRAFINYTSLQSVTIPETVTAIGAGAFNTCTSLTTVTVLGDLSSIGDYAFYDCNNLATFDYRGTKQPTIGTDAFENTKITSVTVQTTCTHESGTLTYTVNADDATKHDVACSCGGYTMTEEHSTAKDENKATCRNKAKCDDCGTSYGELGGHSTDTETNKCTVCGYIGGTCGETATWSFDEETGTLTVSGTGAMENYSAMSPAPWESYRGEITSVEIAEGITSIGNYAFVICTDLTTVTIPASVTTIGNSAFSKNENLTTVTFAEGSKLTAIGEKAFYFCLPLSGVTIPASVKSIDSNVFGLCDNLKTITMEGAPPTLETGAFVAGKNQDGTDVIKVEKIFITCGEENSYKSNTTWADYQNLLVVWDSIANATVTGIDESYAWTGNQIKPEITVTDARGKVLTEGTDYTYRVDNNSEVGTATVYINGAGDYAGTQKVVTFEITNPTGKCGENATYVFDPTTGKLTISGEGAIWDTEVSDNGGVYTIWNDYYWQIESIEIEDGITHIGNYAFFQFSNLTKVSLPDSLVSVGKSAFEYCEKLTEIALPSALKTIGGFAFGECDLTSVTVPDSVTEIGERAFVENKSLTSVTLPENDDFTLLDYRMFDGCTKLQEVTIPSSVTFIDQHIFEYSGVTTVYMTGNAPTITNYTFDYELTIYVSGTTASGYEGARWDIVNVVYVDQITADTVSMNTSCDYYGNDYDYDFGVTVTNYDGTVTLTEGTDYEISYAFNPDEKTGTVTITGIGNYGGTVTKNITIDNIYYGKCGDNATYSFDPATGNLTISGDGDMADYLPWSDYKDKIISLEIAGDITDIDTSAFDGCTNLTAVSVPCGWAETPLYTFGDGVTVTIRAHEFGASGKCLYCPAQAAASVSIAGNTTYYLSFTDAITAAQDIEGCTVTTLDNVTVDSTIYIASGNFTLDLNGKTITGADYYLFALKNNTNITLKDSDEGGTVEAEIPFKLNDASHLTLESGTVYATLGAIMMDNGGNANEATLTVSGGTVISRNSNGILALGNAVTVLGGEFITPDGRRDIYYHQGILELSDYSDAAGIKLYIDSGASSENIKIPEGYKWVDESGNIADVLVPGNHYTLKKQLGADNVTVIGTYTYSGSAIIPTVIVTHNGKELELGVDYQLSCYDNINAGSAEVKVTGIGDYCGNVIDNFAIVPREVVLVWENTDMIYNNSRQTPVARLYGIAPGDVCEVTVEGWGKYGGTYTARATALSNPNYVLPASTECRFTITADPIRVAIDITVDVYEIIPDGVKKTVADSVTNAVEETVTDMAEAVCDTISDTLKKFFESISNKFSSIFG